MLRDLIASLNPRKKGSRHTQQTHAEVYNPEDTISLHLLGVQESCCCAVVRATTRKTKELVKQ